MIWEQTRKKFEKYPEELFADKNIYVADKELEQEGDKFKDDSELNKIKEKALKLD